VPLPTGTQIRVPVHMIEHHKLLRLSRGFLRYGATDFERIGEKWHVPDKVRNHQSAQLPISLEYHGEEEDSISVIYRGPHACPWMPLPSSC